MKRIILLTTLFILSGCSYFTSEPESLTAENQASQADTQTQTNTEVETEEAPAQESEAASESYPANDTFDNVFDESVIGEDRYPETTLPDSIPIGELRAVIDEFYTQVLPEEEKEVNFERIDPETLNTLQSTFDENEVYEPLDITVDQVAMELGDETSYIARIVIGIPYEEAEEIQEDNDILVLNETLSQLENRLVLVAYYDEEADTLTPYHLNNSTTSIFSMADNNNASSSDESSEENNDTNSDESSEEN